MYWIEFIGLPGVGKSTIRQNLVARLQVRYGKRCLSYEDALLYVSRKKIDALYRVVLKVMPDKTARRFFKRLLNRSQMFFEAQERFRHKNAEALNTFLFSGESRQLTETERAHGIEAFLRTGAFYECINGEFPDQYYIFFDEGFIQKTLMFISYLTESHADKRNVYTFIEQISQPDIIVYVKAEKEECCKRVLSRPTGLTERLKGKDAMAIERFYMAADDHLEQLALWLKNNSGSTVIEVYNDCGIETAVGELEDKIRHLLERKRHGE